MSDGNVVIYYTYQEASDWLDSQIFQHFSRQRHRQFRELMFLAVSTHGISIPCRRALINRYTWSNRDLDTYVALKNIHLGSYTLTYEGSDGLQCFKWSVELRNADLRDLT